ncbi:hypothetical protein Tsubulata_046036 [Turnera subulata]|uniref:Late embryogenesis abundant protein LEA-2 subgroup domain-containing protein n=1 Tax=Turnera subulata TaxID=218843 RepID=A0A9Q0GAD9_9ROSI|nr:hypothetical protein Tsubulata_046036 [Turnera subulata]
MDGERRRSRCGELVSNLTVSNSSLGVSGTWSARFVVCNPNKKLRLKYYDVISMVYYRSELLAQTWIPPFKQEIKNVTSLTAEYSTADSYISGRAAGNINADKGRGSVVFDLKVMADAGFYSGGFRIRRRVGRVLCLDVGVWRWREEEDWGFNMDGVDDDKFEGIARIDWKIGWVSGFRFREETFKGFVVLLKRSEEGEWVRWGGRRKGQIDVEREKDERVSFF